MEPLWKIRSGKLAGYRTGNGLYDLNGNNIGHFSGDIAYNLNGRFIGEIYKEKYIGKRNKSYPDGVSYSAYSNLDVIHYDNKEGLNIDGWQDPNF